MAGFREDFYSYIKNDVFHQNHEDLPILLHFLKIQAQQQAKNPDQKGEGISPLLDALERQKKGKHLPKQEKQKLLKQWDSRRAVEDNKRTRTNIYSQLWEADILRQLGVITESEYLLYAFNLALNMKKIGISDALLEKAYALLSDCDLPDRSRLHLSMLPKRTNRRQLMEICSVIAGLDSLQVRADKEKSYESSLKSVTDEIFYMILMLKAKTWLDDNNPEKARKTDNTMQLLDSVFRQEGAYYGFKGGQTGNGALTADQTEARMEQAQVLFKLLDKDPERRNVVIPVMIDPFTGLGLYIIGAGEDESRTYESYRARHPYRSGGYRHQNYMIDVTDSKSRSLMKQHNCVYAVFAFSNIVYDQKSSMDETRGYLEYSVISDHLDGISAIGGNVFPGDRFVDAASYYKGKLAEFDESFDNSYSICNQEAPEGCPDLFLRYFECEEQLWDERISRYKEEEKENK